MSSLSWLLCGTAVLAVVFFILLLRQGAGLLHWRNAAGQVAFVWSLSNVPILFLLMESALMTEGPSTAEILFTNVRSGEAIIYVAAILAPVLFTLIWNFRPAAKLYVLINIAGILVCVGTASYIYARHLANVPANQPALVLMTGTLYVLSLIFWYFSLVYELIITSPSPGTQSSARAAQIRDSLS